MRLSPIVPVTTTSGGPSDGTIPTLRPHGRAQALRHEGRLRGDHGHGRQIKRQHEPQRIIGDLLTAEVNEKQARSSRVQHLAASLRQRKELRRKPYHPIGMGLLYLTEIAATNFLRGGILRHFKNAPPLVLFGLLGLFRGPLTLPMPPYLGLPLLFALPLTLEL